MSFPKTIIDTSSAAPLEKTLEPEHGECYARKDRTHCVHWWDEELPCCACGFNGGTFNNE